MEPPVGDPEALADLRTGRLAREQGRLKKERSRHRHQSLDQKERALGREHKPMPACRAQTTSPEANRLKK